jgi:hypothetical protein
MTSASRASMERWLPAGVAVLAFCGYWFLRPVPWTGWDVARSLLLGASLGVLQAELRRSASLAVALACVALVGFSPAMLLAGGQAQAGWVAALRFSWGVLAVTLVARTGGWTSIAFGALVGWLVWTRPTDIALLLVPLSFLVRGRGRVLAALTTACAASWLVGAMSGRAAEISWTVPAPLDALWSPRGGLLYWQPVLWLGILALLAAFRSRPVAALWGVAPLLLLALWPAAGQDLERWIVVLPLLALALAGTLERVVDLAQRRPGWVLASAGLVLLVWNLLLMAQYREPSFPRDETVSFVDLEEGNARILTRALGSPLTWPASWIFAWRSGLPAFRYEYLAGRSLLEGPDALGGRLDIGDDLARETMLLGEGWGVRHASAAGVCREVLGRAEVFAPLARPARLSLLVTAAGSGTLTVWQDEIRRAVLPIGPASSRLRVPSLSLPRGLTIFRVEGVPGSMVCVVRWELARAASAPE